MSTDELGKNVWVLNRDRWMRMFKYWVRMGWKRMLEYWVGMSWMIMFEYWVGMSWMRMILLARCFLLFLVFTVSSCKNSRRERLEVVKSLKMESFQAVLRIRIRWIRKILASWIRLRKNVRIHGFGSKGQNINQKKIYSRNPNLSCWNKERLEKFLISEWFIKF